MMLNDENRKIMKKPGGRTLYIALSVCVLAAGAVGFSAMRNTSAIRKAAQETTEERQTYVNIQNRSDAVTAPSMPEIIEPPEPSDVELTTVPAELPEAQSEEDAQAVFGDDGGTTEETEEENSGTEEKPEYRMPLSFNIGQDYSMGLPVFSETMSDYRTHNGVDFLGSEGEDVGSVGEGDVISVKKDAVWGNQVTVDHGDGLISTVCGLADDEQLVAPGTHVYAGTVIGRVGSVPVEAGEASHIHLEIRYNGKTVDPLTLFGADANDAD